MKKKKPLDFWLEEEFNNCVTNLKHYQNLGDLGFDCKELVEQAINEKRYNLSSTKPFNYNIGPLLTTLPQILKKQKMVIIMDHQVSLVLKKYPSFKQKLKRMFRANFADASFVTALCEFFIRLDIDILDIEPPHPNTNNALDILIRLGNTKVFLEATSPIQAVLNSYYRGDVAQKMRDIAKDKAHAQIKGITAPTILAVNVSGGIVTNEMFFCIKKVELQNNIELPPNISGLIIKGGNKLRFYQNNSANYAIPQKEWSLLTKIPVLTKMKSLISCHHSGL